MANNPTGWFDANLTSKGWFDETLENAGWFDESAITVTSGGATTITGTMATTDSADTAAFVGDHGQDGILSATDAADSFAAAGDIGHVGTLSATDGADSAAVAGDVCHVGTLATTEEVDTASVAGAVAHVGSLAVIEGEDSSVIDGVIENSTVTSGRGGGAPVKNPIVVVAVDGKDYRIKLDDLTAFLDAQKVEAKKTKPVRIRKNKPRPVEVKHEPPQIVIKSAPVEFMPTVRAAVDRSNEILAQIWQGAIDAYMREIENEEDLIWLLL